MVLIVEDNQRLMVMKMTMTTKTIYLWSMVMYCLISLAISTAWSVWIL